jgi:predicted DNA-binding transcriptional regulator YafY
MPLAQSPDTTGGAVWSRVWWLHNEIQANKTNAPNKQQLRERFGISESCATQTIAFMRDQLQLPLEYDRSRGGYVYREAPPVLPAAHPGLLVSSTALTALRLATSLASRYLGANVTADLESLASRLLAVCDHNLAAEHDRWQQNVVFTGPTPLRARYLREVRAAIERRHVLRLGYHAPGNATELERRVEPHFLVNASGDWLLVAWDRDRDAPRTFALDRIEWCEELRARFERRSQLTGDAFTRYQFLSEGSEEPYDLVVRFPMRAVRIALERRWHPSQRSRTAEDGRLELTLTVSGTGDVLRWLLSFGGAVEVISPARMRRLLHEESRAAAEINHPGK